MFPLFWRKREEGKTVLVLDIENGSVGVCFAHLSPTHQPKIFGELRKQIPLQLTHDTDALTKLTMQATESVLEHASQVAARVRSHGSLAPAGEVGEAVLFFSPPWGALSLTDRELDPHPFTHRVAKSVEAYFGPITTTMEPFGLMAAHTAPMILPLDDHYLLSTVSGEVTELMLIEHAGTHFRTVGHATIPMGRHYPLRTLLSHGGFSEAEARSALHLHSRRATPHHAFEALHSAQNHYASEFGSVAGELLQHVPARSILVVAQEPAGEWFARSLAESRELASLFPEAGEVRAARASHALPFVAVHARRPDLPLLLEVLFVNTRFTGQV